MRCGREHRSDLFPIHAAFPSLEVLQEISISNGQKHLLAFLLLEDSARGAVGASWGSQFFGQPGTLASRGSH